MFEKEVRAMFKKLAPMNPTLLRIDVDEKTGKVRHAEIHCDEGPIWTYKGKAKIKNPAYGSTFKFSLARPDYQLMAMERPAS